MRENYPVVLTPLTLEKCCLHLPTLKYSQPFKPQVLIQYLQPHKQKKTKQLYKSLN